MKIALVAGEASGDLLAAGLIREMRRQVPGAEFEGVAGPAMIAAGCAPLADAASLSVMGLIEPLAELPRLLRLRRRLIRRWLDLRPDVFIGIDAPDFNFGLEKRLRRAGIRTVHYVSPSVWAWRPGRIETVRQAADRLLCILPFEKPLYDARGVDAVYVGHPKADQISRQTDTDTAAARRALGLGARTTVAVLPGSREGEVARLGPIFAAAVARLHAADKQIQFAMPAASKKLRNRIETQLAEHGLCGQVAVVDGRSIDVMAAADVVLLASGTAALEAALLGKPMVAAYRVAGATARLVRAFKLLKLAYFTLPNLLTEEPLVPEFIQEAATPESLSQAILSLLDDPVRRASITERFAKLHEELALGADARAAKAVVDLARQ